MFTLAGRQGHLVDQLADVAVLGKRLPRLCGSVVDAPVVDVVVAHCAVSIQVWRPGLGDFWVGSAYMAVIIKFSGTPGRCPSGTGRTSLRSVRFSGGGFLRRWRQLPRKHLL